MVHDQMLKSWERAQTAQHQLQDKFGCKHRSGPVLAPLRQLVDGLGAEIEYLPSGSGQGLAAERLICKLLRRGIEVLVAAALVDTAATLSHVALNFTGPLLQAVRSSGPHPCLEQRCHLLLGAIGKVAESFQSFMTILKDGLANKAAAEWRGCNEIRLAAGVVDHTGIEQQRAEEHVGVPIGTGDEAPQMLDAGVRIESDTTARSGALDTKEVEQGSHDEVDVYLPEAQALQMRTHYTESKEWRTLRALCVRNRLCVDFNRDAGDERCVVSDCCFKHTCALCGAVARGSRKFQDKCHGAWNCHLLLGWLAEQQCK